MYRLSIDIAAIRMSLEAIRFRRVTIRHKVQPKYKNGSGSLGRLFRLIERGLVSNNMHYHEGGL